MQTLYGIKITDRVTVKEAPPGSYNAYFDGQFIAQAFTGRGAVGLALNWLQDRAFQQKEDRKRQEEREAQNQIEDDNQFLYDLARKLGVEKDDLDTLIEIANRRK